MMQLEFALRLTTLEIASKICNFSSVFRKNIGSIAGGIYSLCNILLGIACEGQALFVTVLFIFGFMVCTKAPTNFPRRLEVMTIGFYDKDYKDTQGRFKALKEDNI